MMRSYAHGMNDTLEINEFNKDSGASEEDHKKLEIEEGLDETEKALLLLGKSNIVQQISALISLPKLMQNEEAKLAILPRIYEDMGKWDDILQIETVNSLNSIVLQKSLNEKEERELFGITMKMLSTWSDTALESWITLYSSLIQQLPLDYIKQESISLTDSLCDISQPLTSRKTAARIIGSLVQVMSNIDFFNQLVKKVKRLCIDYNWEVRYTMAKYMKDIILKLGPALTQSGNLIEEIVELLDDEEIDVRTLILQALAQTADHFQEEAKILSSMKSQFVVNSLILENEILYNLGGILFKIGYDIFSQDIEFTRMLNDLLQKVIEKGDSGQKALISYNMPAFAVIYSPEIFVQEYLPVLKELLNGDEQPKQPIASSLHHIAKLLGVELSEIHIKSLIFTLLSDNNSKIVSSIFGNIFEICNIFNEGINNNFVNELAGMLPKIGNKVKTQWRYYTEFFNQLMELIPLFTIEQIHKYIFPQFSEALRLGSTKTREVIGKLIGQILRDVPSKILRSDIHELLLKDFCNSPSSFERKIFLDICEIALDILSKTYFRENFLQVCFKLSTDSVTNVVLSFIRRSPRFRRGLLYDDQKNSQFLKLLLKDLTEHKVPQIRSEAAEVLRLIEDPDFLNQLNDINEKVKIKHETEVKRNEIILTKESKKKEVDDLLNQHRMNYIQKVNNSKLIPSKKVVPGGMHKMGPNKLKVPISAAAPGGGKRGVTPTMIGPSNLWDKEKVTKNHRGLKKSSSNVIVATKKK